MKALQPVTIAGGGLAGLALGIGLRQQEVPVTIYEAGHYPRHRVCGEFISGRGQAVLTRLGLKPVLDGAGAIHAETAAFFVGAAHSPPRLLQPVAWCLSRFVLDAVLAQEFRRLGGYLCENQRLSEADGGPGFVRANGRRPKPVEQGWRWFGLKVHARGVAMRTDLEMHAQPQGYVGLCRLPGGETNVCGLFRRPGAAHDSAPRCQRSLLGAPGTLLHERLENATLDAASFCAVAGLPLRPQRAVGRTECCLGDALTMIPPVTGNGMSMAFEAAESAIEPIVAWSRGELDWVQATAAVARRCDKAFAHRLGWAKVLQWVMFTPAMTGRLGGMLLSWQWLWNLMFARTR